MTGFAASQFEHHLLDAFGCGNTHLDARLLTAGESRRCDARVVENAVDRP